MEIQYILIRKNKSEAKRIRIQSEVKTVLNDASFCVENDIIYFCKENKDIFVLYRMSYEDNNVLYLNITTSLRNESAAKLLNEFDKRFTKGTHRSKFYIINAYSDVSQFFCKKLMPVLGSFERLLREFLYLTLTRSYGSEWVKIINLELKKHIAKISKGKVSKDNEYIEKSLEWLEFGALEEVLFTPCTYEDIDTVISEILSSEEITKDEILDKLKTVEKKSLWEREFQEFSEVNNLQDKFNEIKDIRNTVMHNKTINLQYYEDSKNTIEAVNKQLIKAIEKIEKDIFDKPKDRKTIVFDNRVFVEAIWKSLEQSKEIERKIELGKRLTERFNKLYGSAKISDLINSALE